MNRIFHYLCRKANDNIFFEMLVRLIVLFSCLFRARLSPILKSVSLFGNKNKTVIIYLQDETRFFNLKVVIDRLHDVAELKNIDVHIISDGKIEVLNGYPKFRTLNGIKLYELSVVTCDLFLTPTDVSTKAFTPIGCQSVCFVHSLVGIDGISHDSFCDGFKYIFIASKPQLNDFVTHYNKRDVTTKILIQGGYPKLDFQMEERKGDGCNDNIVVIALTYDNGLNSEWVIIKYVKEIIKTLLERQYVVYFRPHPASFTHFPDKPILEDILNEYQNEGRLIIDRSRNYSEVFARSKFMISDISGTAYTYSLSQQKPVLFMAPRTCEISSFHFADRTRVGLVVNQLSEFPDAIFKLENCYGHYVSEVARYRTEIIFNVGTSGKYFISILDDLLNGEVPANSIVV